MGKYVLREGVVYRKEADGALIYHHSTGDVTPLNATAAYMCEALFLEQQEPEAVLAGIRERWHVKDEELVRSDLDRFITGMLQLELIEERVA